MQLQPVDPGDPAHVEAILDIHSRPEIIRWLEDPSVLPMASAQEARAWLERHAQYVAADSRQFQRMIRVGEARRVVGHVSIGPLFRQNGGFVGEYEIGWTLRPSATGYGYATRAARALAGEAFADGAEELVIDMWEDNAPSAAVARRLGAQDLGVRDDPWYGGQSRMFLLHPEHLDG